MTTKKQSNDTKKNPAQIQDLTPISNGITAHDDPASAIKSLQHAEDEDDAMFERLVKKSSYSFLNFHSRSICCTLLIVVGLTIFSLLGVCVAWAMLYVAETDSFGKELIQNTFREISLKVESDMNTMASVVEALNSDRSLLPSNLTWEGVQPKIWDIYNTAARQYGDIAAHLYGPNLTTHTFITPFGSGETLLLMDDNILTPNKMTGFIYNASQPETGLISRFPPMPSDLPQRHADLKEYPLHFRAVTPLSCKNKGKTCTFLLIGCQTALFENGVISHSLQLQLSVKSLSNSLSELTRHGAISFLIERRDQSLIAISHLEVLLEKDREYYSPFDFVGETDDAFMRKADTYPVDQIAKSTKHLKEQFGDDLLKLNHVGQYNFTIDSSSVQAKVISLLNGKQTSREGILDEIVVVHIIDSQTFTASAYQLSSIFTLVTIAIGILSLCAMNCISFLIGRPLRKLIRQMESAKMLQFDKVNTNSFNYFSEVRQIQGSFYFMTHSMKQYRSFLPAHVLQTVEAKLQQAASQGRKKKKSSNKINPCKQDDIVAHEVDSMVSDENQSIDAQSRRSYSNAESSSSNRIRHQFHVGGMRRSITIVEVHIIGLEDILKQTALEDFIHMHSSLVETIEQAVNTTKGATFNHFDHDRFLISLNSTISCRDRHEKQGAFLSMKLKDRLQRCNASLVREGFRELPLLICVSSGWAVVSLLGSANMKQQTMHGQPLLLSKIIRDSTVSLLLNKTQQDSLFSGGNVPVLVDHKVKDKLSPNMFESKQVNHLEICQPGDSKTQTVPVYQINSPFANGQCKDKEWLYTMRDDELMKRHKKNIHSANSAWEILMKHSEVERAMDLIREVLQNGNAAAHDQIFEKYLLETAHMVQKEFDSDMQEYMDVECSGGRDMSQWRNTENMMWRSVLNRTSARTDL